MACMNIPGTIDSLKYMFAKINRNKNLIKLAISADSKLPIFVEKNLNASINAIFPSQTKGRKYNKNGVAGPKIIPRDKTPRLGRMAIGNKYLFGKKATAKNKIALTIEPTSN